MSVEIFNQLIKRDATVIQTEHIIIPRAQPSPPRRSPLASVRRPSLMRRLGSPNVRISQSRFAGLLLLLRAELPPPPPPLLLHESVATTGAWSDGQVSSLTTFAFATSNAFLERKM